MAAPVKRDRVMRVLAVPPKLKRILIPPILSESGRNGPVGGRSHVTALIELMSPALSGGAVVKLSSSKPEVASVPGELVIPEGRSSATFDIKPLAVASSTDLWITATLSSERRTALLTILPPCAVRLDIPGRIVFLEFYGEWTRLIGGRIVSGSVWIDSIAPPGGLVISPSVVCTARDVEVLDLPREITIPEWTSWGDFEIRVHALDSPCVATIFASDDVWRSILVEPSFPWAVKFSAEEMSITFPERADPKSRVSDELFDRWEIGEIYARAGFDWTLDLYSRTFCVQGETLVDQPKTGVMCKPDQCSGMLAVDPDSEAAESLLRRHLDSLTERLMMQGWSLLYSHGPNWYSRRFARNPGRAKWEDQRRRSLMRQRWESLENGERLGEV